MKKIISVIAAALIIMPQTLSTVSYADEPSESEYVEFAYTVIDEDKKTIGITSASNFKTTLEIPSEIDGYTVTEIEKQAFFGCAELTEITLPDTVTAIGDNAFAGCLSLTEAVLPDSVEKLGVGCFLSCTSLKYAHLGESLKEIPKNCFYSCTSLSRLHIPESTGKIGAQAFFGCAGLSGLYISDAVSEIGENAIGRRYNIRNNTEESIYGFIIRGESGSAAEAYALDCGLIFLDGRIETGDVNGDGSVDAVDASLVLTEYAAASSGGESVLFGWQFDAADWNSDGAVDAVDATAILTEYARRQVD